MEIRTWNDNLVIRGDITDTQPELVQCAIDNGVCLYGLNFKDWDFTGVDFKDNPMLFCYLEDAKLDGIKNYGNSHSIFMEIVQQQPIGTFTEEEWAVIGKTIGRTLCWESQINHMKVDVLRRLYSKISSLGWPEYLINLEKEIKKN